MNPRLEKLKQQAEENPLAAVGAGAMLITAIAKLMDAGASVRSKNAYAKAEKRRAKTYKKK